VLRPNSLLGTTISIDFDCPAMTIPKISLVTPSFNQAEFVESTMRSVLAQDGLGTEFDLQYIVIDGGSTDGSVEIIKKYAQQLAHWRSEPDRGQAHALNKGFELATGEIRGFLNSDDILQPGALRRVAREFRRHPEMDLLHGVCLKIDERGRVTSEQISTIQSLLDIVDIWNFWLRLGDNRNFVQPEVFWSSRLAQSIGPFREDLYYTLDYEFWLRGFEKGLNIRRIDVALAGFRIHGKQKTSDQLGAIAELIELIEPILAREDDPRLPAADRKRIRDLAEMTKRQISGGGLVAVRDLLFLAADRPRLLQSRRFWKNVRRTGRSLFRAA
jgi:glycosyltransferase involved in cell wall biosynthesis